MKITVQMDAMGCLHVWNGGSKPYRVDKYLWEMDGRQADYYIQSDWAVEDFLSWFSAEIVESIDKGWNETVTVPDELLD